MADIKIDSPAYFSMYIERILRESKNVPGIRTQKALEEFAEHIFMLGFNAGKRPENHPRFKMKE